MRLSNKTIFVRCIISSKSVQCLSVRQNGSYPKSSDCEPMSTYTRRSFRIHKLPLSISLRIVPTWGFKSLLLIHFLFSIQPRSSQSKLSMWFVGITSSKFFIVFKVPSTHRQDVERTTLANFDTIDLSFSIRSSSLSVVRSVSHDEILRFIAVVFNTVVTDCTLYCLVNNEELYPRPCEETLEAEVEELGAWDGGVAMYRVGGYE